MTPNTMTLDEVRDELARRDGWERYEDGQWYKVGEFARPDHPHPATLDGAAAALPKGWRLWDLEEHADAWTTSAVQPSDDRKTFELSMQINSGPNELTARYRLALACRIAEEGK